MTGSQPMLFSHEELEIIEACVLICLSNRLLHDKDTITDAHILLATVRDLLHKDAEGVADAIAEAIKAKYHAAEGSEE